MRRDYPAEAYKTSLISWFRIHCLLSVVTLLKECKNAAKHWKTAAAKGYQQQSRGALPTKHLNVSKKKKFHLQVLPLLIKLFLVSKKKFLLKDVLETRHYQHHKLSKLQLRGSSLEGRALCLAPEQSWALLEWEWSRHRWGTLDATAKDANTSPALQYKVNILYPLRARQMKATSPPWAASEPPFTRQHRQEQTA